MKLWYTKPELKAAQAEAQKIVDQYNAEIPLYITGGKVAIRMAWREDKRSLDAVPLDEARIHGKDALLTYIPEAELLFNDEVIRKEFLDLILIDINRLEMNAIMQSR